MRTFADEAARQSQSWSAIRAQMQRSLVFIIDGPSNEQKRGRPNGSGTLLRSPGGKDRGPHCGPCFERSAAGILPGRLHPTRRRDGQPFALTFKHPKGDEQVDVAVALLTPQAAASFGAGAISIESVAATSVELGERDSTVICGFSGAVPNAEVRSRQEDLFRGLWRCYL